MDWSQITPTTTLSLPERLSIEIEQLILEGSLDPGDRLPPERELASYFRVSRVSIREALRELENRGLIDRRPGRGTIVLSPGETAGTVDPILGITASLYPGLHHIMELRVMIEPPIARLTASRATARDVAQLLQLIEAMERDPSKEKYAELDRAFHQSIAQYTHNPHLALLNEQIAQQISPSRADRYQTKERRAVSSKAHRRIFDAIASGNGSLAEHEAREHVVAISSQLALYEDTI